MTVEDAVAGIAATTAYQGLKVTAVLDDGDYPEGVKISGERMKYLEDRVLDRHHVHGEWNCTLLPAPRPAPEPRPEPERAGGVPRDVLNQPALTGMNPEDAEALAAALEVPFAARREQDLWNRRGHARGGSAGAGAPRRIDLLDHVLMLRFRDHLHLPGAVAGALPGTSQATASRAARLTAELLTSSGIPLPATGPPPGIELRTTADLLEYAMAAGITLTIPEKPPKPAKCPACKHPETATHPRPPI
jgi:hypothetical protein